MKVGRAHPTCLDMMSLVFRGHPFSLKKSLVAQAFQPVPAQAKTCGYILSIYPLNTEFKSLPDTTALPPFGKGGNENGSNIRRDLLQLSTGLAK